MTEAQILHIIHEDRERMCILEAVAGLGLEDWWVAAGFVRNKVWDELFGGDTNTKLNDVDVVYWKPLDSYGMDESALVALLETDQENPVWAEEHEYRRKLSALLPEHAFEVKNQARMHLWSGRDHTRQPYRSAAAAIGDWPETATAVGVKLASSGTLELLAVHGIQDLVQGIIRPTRPDLEGRVRQRAADKQWVRHWPGLRFEPYQSV